MRADHATKLVGPSGKRPSYTEPVKRRRVLVTCLDDVTDRYVLNMKDVGAILDIHPRTAGELCSTGQIVGAFRVGRQLRIFAGDLRIYWESRRLPLESPLSKLREAVRRNTS